MSPAADDALAGLRLLVTRPPARVGRLVDRVEALGGHVEARPVIAFAPPVDPDPATAAVSRLDSYDWIVLTSPTAVVRFFARAGRRPAARFAVVGPGSAAELARYGIAADLVGPGSGAAELAAALAASVDVAARVLVVRPERGREALVERLRAAGAAVDAVAFYRTVAAAGAGALARDVADDRFDVALFSSPSSLELLLAVAGSRSEALSAALRRVVVVAIGRTTAAAFVRAGRPADGVADEPTDDAMIAAIRTAVAGRRRS